MHTYHAEKWNKSLLFVSDITGSGLKKKSWHICRTNDVIGAVLRVSMTADCLQTSFVEKS